MILCTSGMVSSRDIIATYETKRQLRENLEHTGINNKNEAAQYIS